MMLADLCWWLISVLFIDCPQSIYSGTDNGSLHFFSNIAGNLSGPAAELGDSSLIACSMSSGEKFMSVILGWFSG